MLVNDELGKRMKDYYENISKIKLTRRTPVIIRLDGKNFHTFTRGFKKPFDEILIKSMQETMKYLCENVQGCVLGYTQSDEITLVIIDYQNLNTSAWFDYDAQKICSISGSMATLAFNKSFTKNAEEFMSDCAADYEMKGLYGKGTLEYELCGRYQSAIQKGAMFDARCFNIPKEEVVNCLYWRQIDVIRNSVQMVGQANYSSKQLDGKSCNRIKEMLLSEKNIDWDSLPIYQQRGSCCIKKTYYPDMTNTKLMRTHWVIDNEIPIFKDDRDYIERYIYIGE